MLCLLHVGLHVGHKRIGALHPCVKIPILALLNLDLDLAEPRHKLALRPAILLNVVRRRGPGTAGVAGTSANAASNDQSQGKEGQEHAETEEPNKDNRVRDQTRTEYGKQKPRADSDNGQSGRP